MRIEQAHPDDVPALARLLWLDTRGVEPERPSVDAFAGQLARWWATCEATHVAFVARMPEAGVVGMAWIAFAPRVPRPGAVVRMSGDVQSVFVVPEMRGRGIGSALVSAVAEHAERYGAARVTVHSGRRAVPLYERLGFAPSPQLLLRPPEA